MTQFDASIDLTVHNVPEGVAPTVAIDRVRAAVEAIPGAGWISVEWCGAPPARLPYLRVYRPGSAHPQVGGSWDVLADAIDATTRATLDAERPR